MQKERTTTGLAARDPSGILSPHTYTLRSTGPDDVYIKVGCCGICHTDLHQIKNDLGISKYPMVPGHEIVGEVMEVGSDVTKFKVGDCVGVGYIIGCCGQCSPCKSNIEQYCNKKIWTFNDVYLDGKPTQGGFAREMVVHQKFVVKIPDGMVAEQAAPLLCAGLTAYSPLMYFGYNRSGVRGGILGLGGIGHMVVKIAKAMGHHVTVISSSNKKREEALEHLGADAYLVSSEATGMQVATDSLDYIIDTIPVFHPLEAYLSLLKVNGKLILTGIISTPLQFITPALTLGKPINRLAFDALTNAKPKGAIYDFDEVGLVMFIGRKSINGTLTGSVEETEEMLEFCKEKGVTSMVEVVNTDYVNKAMERLEKNDVRYRFVLDIAGSKMS